MARAAAAFFVGCRFVSSLSSSPPSLSRTQTRRAARARARVAAERALHRLRHGPVPPEVAAREAVARPALCRLVAGESPSGAQRLRRNVALHSVVLPRSCSPMSCWRAAQHGPRLGSRRVLDPCAPPFLPIPVFVWLLAAELFYLTPPSCRGTSPGPGPLALPAPVLRLALAPARLRRLLLAAPEGRCVPGCAPDCAADGGRPNSPSIPAFALTSGQGVEEDSQGYTSSSARSCSAS